MTFMSSSLIPVTAADKKTVHSGVICMLQLHATQVQLFSFALTAFLQVLHFSAFRVLLFSEQKQGI